MNTKLLLYSALLISCKSFSMDKQPTIAEIVRQTDQMKSLEEKQKEMTQTVEIFKQLESQKKNNEQRAKWCYWCCLTCCFPNLCNQK